MAIKERRKYPRIKTVNVFAYVSLDKHGKKLSKGKGRTLDLSQGGILLETEAPIKAPYIIIMAINIKKELINIKGKVTYSNQAKSNTFHTGVSFIETNERIVEIIVEMVKTFSRQKSKSRKNPHLNKASIY